MRVRFGLFVDYTSGLPSSEDDKKRGDYEQSFNSSVTKQMWALGSCGGNGIGARERCMK